MGNYGGLYLPMMIVGYVFSAPFFLLTVRTSQKLGQKASLVRYTTIALAMYVGVLVLLLLWRPGAEVFRLSLMPLNIYTVLFVLFFGIGYGAYYATADMPIPMVADCSDYETYCGHCCGNDWNQYPAGRQYALCRRNAYGGSGAVLRHSHAGLDCNFNRHERLYPYRSQDEGNSGGERGEKRCHWKRHEAV